MSPLHSISDEEAAILEARAEALTRFKGRYRHNPESQRAMVGALRRVAKLASDGQCDETNFPWDIITDDDLALQVWSSVAAVHARATAVKDASALRVMLDCCRRVGLISHDEYAEAVAFEARGGRVTEPAGHYLSELDVRRLVEACAATGSAQTRLRDKALVLTLASTGARTDEVVHVRLRDVFLAERRVYLRKTKSGQPRDAWLHPAAVNALEAWIGARGTCGEALFPPLSRTGRPLTERGQMSTLQVWKVIRARGAQAGLEPIGSHDLRRFVVTTLLENGFDIALVAKTVGHKNPTTTAGYDKRPGERQREAVAQINLPLISDL